MHMKEMISASPDTCIFLSMLLLSRSVLSNFLWPHGLQHVRLLSPSLSPRICSNLCQLSQLSLPTISSSVVPFSYPQSFPAPGSFPMSQLFTSGSQSIGVSVQHQSFQWIFTVGFPLGLTGLISLQPKGLSSVFISTIVWKHQFFSPQPSLWPSSHIPTWLLEKS